MAKMLQDIHICPTKVIFMNKIVVISVQIILEPKIFPVTRTQIHNVIYMSGRYIFWIRKIYKMGAIPTGGGKKIGKNIIWIGEF